MKNMTVKELKSTKRAMTIEIKQLSEYIKEMHESMSQQIKDGKRHFYFHGDMCYPETIQRYESDLELLKIKRVNLNDEVPVKEAPVEEKSSKIESVIDEEIELKTIGWHNLVKLIKLEIGVDFGFDSHISTIQGVTYLTLTSNNLADEAGIMGKMYDSLIIKGSGKIVGEGKDRMFSINLDYSFRYKKGGSNGTSLCSAWYNMNTRKWIKVLF